ncbi:MAG: dihydroorotase, partial [Casimicrobiaceae bacterium]
MKIEIKDGRLIDPAAGIDRMTSLYIAAGKVAAIGAAPAGWSANRVIDARGLVVCPGLIDVAARLREPGLEYKATLESEVRAAIAGGVTSLACPPDTDPPLDEPGLVEMLKHRARSLNLAHVYPVGALTVQLAGTTLTEMGELAEAGCVAFSQADAPIVDTQVLLRAMQYAATFGHRVWLRAQDPHLARGGVAHDGEVATRLGLTAIPVAAETIALGTILALIRETGVRVHLCRLSSAEGVAMVRAAKREGLAVTADVAIHHLHLCDVDIGWFDAQAHLIPPLRGTRDRAALRAGVVDGTIDVVCSDHTPIDDDGKQLPFAEAEPGATGLELLLPLTLKWAGEEKVALPAALARITQ